MHSYFDKKVIVFSSLIVAGGILIPAVLLNRNSLYVQSAVYEWHDSPLLDLAPFALFIAMIYFGVGYFRKIRRQENSGALVQQNGLFQFGRVLTALGSFGSVALARDLGVRYSYDVISQFVYMIVMTIGILVMYLGFDLQQIAYESESNNPKSVKGINAVLRALPSLWKYFWRDGTE